MAFIRSEKEQKYDRQMRLWGGHGQQLLEEAHICVLGGGPTATETLKNLVLPNVGTFTLVDDAKVQESDLGNNFFVDRDSIGQNRAEVITRFMLQMNPDVKGQALVRSPVEVAEDPSFFDQFQLVIATNLPIGSLRKLAATCYGKVPLLIARTNGFMGSLRVQIQEHTIVESKPDADRIDLYVHPDQTANFPELQAYIDSFDMAALDDMQHAHVPYVVILAKEVAKWQKGHGGKVPGTFEEKKEFKEQIKKASRSAKGEEENFEEAVNFATRAFVKPTFDSAVQAVFDDPAAENLTAKSTDFWFLVRAVRDFIKNEGRGNYPVSTDIPDMQSLPEYYVKLKAIYASRAEADVKAIVSHVDRLLTEVGRKAGSIDPVFVDRFVRNVRSLRVVRMRSLAEEYEAKTFNSDLANEILEEYVYVEPLAEGEPELPNPRQIHWYFAQRAGDLFYEKHGRYPGAPLASADVDADTAELFNLTQQFLTQNGIKTNVESDVVQEWVRYGGSEQHNIAAFIGGVASQDGLKILLKQYVPINNTLFFNGVACNASRYEW